MTYPLGDEVLDLRMQCARDTDEVALRADNEHLRELLDQARDAEADAYHASYEAWLGRQDGAQ